MRTRRNKVIGVAAAVLAVTACGIAAGNSGETSAGHPAAASAGHAPAATPVTDQEMLAQIKRDVVLHAGQRARGR